MTQPKKLLYLPGIDASLGAGERLFEFLPELDCLQPLYPSCLASSLPKTAEWLIETYLQAEHDVSFLVGESYGSALGQEVLRRAPQAFERVVFLAGFTSLPRPLLARFLGPLLRVTPKPLIALPIRWLARPLLLQDTTKEERAKFHRVLSEVSFRAMGQRIASLRNFDGRSLQHAAEPRLWIWGEGDTLMRHADERRWLRDARPQEEAVIIAEAGHVLIRSQPETLALHIRRFLGLPPKVAGSLPAKK